MGVREGKRGQGCVLATPAGERKNVRFHCQKRYVAQKGSKKHIQPTGLRDKRVPFLAAPPE